MENVDNGIAEISKYIQKHGGTKSDVETLQKVTNGYLYYNKKKERNELHIPAGLYNKKQIVISDKIQLVVVYAGAVISNMKVSKSVVCITNYGTINKLETAKRLAKSTPGARPTLLLTGTGLIDEFTYYGSKAYSSSVVLSSQHIDKIYLYGIVWVSCVEDSSVNVITGMSEDCYIAFTAKENCTFSYENISHPKGIIALFLDSGLVKSRIGKIYAEKVGVQAQKGIHIECINSPAVRIHDSERLEIGKIESQQVEISEVENSHIKELVCPELYRSKMCKCVYVDKLETSGRVEIIE